MLIVSKVSTTENFIQGFQNAETAQEIFPILGAYKDLWYKLDTPYGLKIDEYTFKTINENTCI